MRSETIENSVHALRVKSRATQEDVAKAVGVTRQTVIAIEKGNYVPSVMLAIRLAEFFRVSVEDIFKIT
jgi:putative transcriptional regulator